MYWIFEGDGADRESGVKKLEGFELGVKACCRGEKFEQQTWRR